MRMLASRASAMSVLGERTKNDTERCEGGSPRWRGKLKAKLVEKNIFSTNTALKSGAAEKNIEATGRNAHKQRRCLENAFFHSQKRKSHQIFAKS